MSESDLSSSSSEECKASIVTKSPSSSKLAYGNNEGPPTKQKELQKYLEKSTNVKKIQSKSYVDINLTDSDDEMWVVQCSSSIKLEKIIESAEFDLETFGKSVMVKGADIESCTEKNESKKPVTIMCGSEFRSFIPAGNIRINEKITGCEYRIKDFSEFGVKIKEEVPFPENLKIRHPLLGADYISSLKLPKAVRVQLELANQKPAKEKRRIKSEPIDTDVPESPSKKRKKKSVKKEKISESENGELDWIKNI